MSNANMWGTRWYARDPVDVVDELEHWHREYKANNFPFHDLTAILKKQWIVDFCKELHSRPFHRDIIWQLPSGTRVEVIDDEVCEWLAKTNGKALNYAPESGSLETRKRVKKRMKDEAWKMGTLATRVVDELVAKHYKLPRAPYQKQAKPFSVLSWHICVSLLFSGPALFVPILS